MNMYELSHFRRDVIELAEAHLTEIQEIVANECRIINANGEGKYTAGVPLVLYNMIPLPQNACLDTDLQITEIYQPDFKQ